jgi:hypothetical protein
MGLGDHLSEGQIERYRQGIAAPSEISIVLEHIELCDTCREALAGPMELRRSYEAFKEFVYGSEAADLTAYDQHPPAWQVSAYVNDRLDDRDREAIDAHIEHCAQCADEMRMLRVVLPTTSFPATGLPATSREESKDISEAVAAPPRRPLALPRPPAASWRPYRINVAQAATWAAILLLCVSILFLRRQLVELRASQSSIAEIGASLKVQTEGISKLQAQMQNLETAGRSVPAESPTSIVLALNDEAGAVTLDSRGALSGLPDLSTQDESLVRETLINKRVEVPSSVRALIGKRETLMGESNNADSFSLLSPLGTTVRELRPTFRWNPLSGATSYTVTVVDSKSLNEVAVSPALTETHWAPLHALSRGKTYIWEVTAAKNEHEIVSPRPPAPNAEFKVLDPKTFSEVTDAESRYRNSHLVLGLVYARAGLLDPAKRELLALEQANPNSDLVQRLVRGLPPSTPR